MYNIIIMVTCMCNLLLYIVQLLLPCVHYSVYCCCILYSAILLFLSHKCMHGFYF